jgi:putative hydrolase
MADPDPDDLPFGGMPMFGDLARAFAAQGPLHWDAARQFAVLTATGGTPEPNVDPAVRFALDELARIADPHVQAVSGLVTAPDGRTPAILPVTPGVWAQRTLEAYRPLFTELATSLAPGPADSEDDTDPAAAMFAGLSRMMAPAMLGMAVGSMVGQLARRAFGQYDLPIPRPASDELLVVAHAVDSFAAEWELAVDEMRLWVVTQELTGHALLRVPHLRDRLTDLVRRHVAAFRPDPSAIVDKLGGLELTGGDPMSALNAVLGDPEVLLGAVRTPEQDALAPILDAMVALVVGYVDHVVDAVAARLLGGGGRIAEAVRRRRVEASPDDVFVERLLGLRLTRDQVQRGRAFVDGVIERAGSDGLAPLLTDADALPTPAELDAPGLWLARLEL